MQTRYSWDKSARTSFGSDIVSPRLANFRSVIPCTSGHIIITVNRRLLHTRYRYYKNVVLLSRREDIAEKTKTLCSNDESNAECRPNENLTDRPPAKGAAAGEFGHERNSAPSCTRDCDESTLITMLINYWTVLRNAQRFLIMSVKSDNAAKLLNPLHLNNLKFSLNRSLLIR